MTATRSAYRVAILALLLVLSGSPTASAEECSSTSYGDGVSLGESTSVADILANPDDWEGKAVRVEGTVEAVCQMKGCWMEIVAKDSDATLRVKVEDDVIVFPAAARGRHAVAQGSVSVKEMTAQEWKGWQHHLAEEQGRKFDPSTLGDGPYRLVQVNGTGAEICQ